MSDKASEHAANEAQHAQAHELATQGAPPGSSIPPEIEEKRTDRTLALILRAVPIALFLWMVRPLLIPIILGALFALILYPIQKKVAPKLGKLAPYAPGIFTVGAIILVVIPFVFIAIKAVATINQFVQKDWTHTAEEAEKWFSERASGYLERFHISVDSIRPSLQNLARSAGSAVASWFGGFATALPGHIVDAFLFVLSLYYFLRDGRVFSRWMLKISPFPHHHTEELFTSVIGTVNGAILGVLVTAGVQGALTMASLYILGVPGAFLLGIVATMLAVLPMVGTTPVTIGAAIYLFATGRVGAGIGMAVMGVVIGLSDNVVRPWVQSSQTTMHPLIALLSIFGGLEVFGAAGIFIGPVLAAIAVWIVDAYADLRMKQLRAYVEARLSRIRSHLAADPHAITGSTASVPDTALAADAAREKDVPGAADRAAAKNEAAVAEAAVADPAGASESESKSEAESKSEFKSESATEAAAESHAESASGSAAGSGGASTRSPSSSRGAPPRGGA
jgi:predicted PurR-regulated permease PerM